MSVTLKLTPTGPEFGVEAPVANLPIRTGRSNTQNWTLDASSERIVALVDPIRVDAQTGPPMSLVVGWQQLLARGK